MTLRLAALCAYLSPVYGRGLQQDASLQPPEHAAERVVLKLDQGGEVAPVSWPPASPAEVPVA